MSDAREELIRLAASRGHEAEGRAYFAEKERRERLVEQPTAKRSDSDMLPWAEDLDGVWHRRPPGRDWVTGDGANAETVCGRRIASVHVSNCEPEGTICSACAAGPIDAAELARRFGAAAKAAEKLGAAAAAAELRDFANKMFWAPADVVEAIRRALLTGETDHG